MADVRFYVGLHILSHTRHFERCMLSVNRFRRVDKEGNVTRERRKALDVNEWIMDSGAFTELSQHGHYRRSEKSYAEYINRWHKSGQLVAAVSQDYMCEPHIVKKTGLDVSKHQALTIERYDRIRDHLDHLGCPVYVMPVLQGYKVEDYLRHIDDYGDRLSDWMWVGIGSVCRRNSNPAEILNILHAIKEHRPTLRLHGFGIKKTSLQSPYIRHLLYSADSMAWSFRARKEGRNANDWKEARAFVDEIKEQKKKAGRMTFTKQLSLWR